MKGIGLAIIIYILAISIYNVIKTADKIDLYFDLTCGIDLSNNIMEALKSRNNDEYYVEDIKYYEECKKKFEQYLDNLRNEKLIFGITVKEYEDYGAFETNSCKNLYVKRYIKLSIKWNELINKLEAD